MDLVIGKYILRESSHSSIAIIDPYNQGSIDQMFQHPTPLPDILYPKERILAYTAKEVVIPHSYVGLIGLRSTWARLGLAAPTTFADPGFHGTLTMEIYNSSRYAIKLRPGDAIWAMILVCAPYEPLYRGRYQGQQGLQLPKALNFNLDKESYATENS